MMHFLHQVPKRKMNRNYKKAHKNNVIKVFVLLPDHLMVYRHPLNFHAFVLEGQCPEWFCGLLIFLRISFTDIIIYDLFIMLRFFS